MFTLEVCFYKKLNKIDTEGQEMETYQIFVVPMRHTNITEELGIQALNDSVTSNDKK